MKRAVNLLYSESEFDTCSGWGHWDPAPKVLRSDKKKPKHVGVFCVLDWSVLHTTGGRLRVKEYRVYILNAYKT